MIKRYRLRSVLSVLLCVVLHKPTLIADHGDGGDDRSFDVDSVVNVYLNWNTFENEGIPTSWRTNVIRCVQNCVEQFAQVSSFKLKPRYAGLTTGENPGNKQIIIVMYEKMPGTSGSGRARAFVWNNRSRIELFRNRRDNTPWNWVPYRADDSTEFDIQCLIMHEMGHSFGMQHNFDTNRSVMGFYKPLNRVGPFEEDVDDLKDLYGWRTDLDFKARRSTNQGESWSGWSTNVTGLSATTTCPPDLTRDSDRMILFYTQHNKKPTWIIGNNTGSSFDTSTWTVFGGERSFYGVAGDGIPSEYMMTWVDDRDDHRIKIVRSTDGGQGWGWRNPPTSRTFGTPDVLRVYGDTWVLAYAKLNRSNPDENGVITARVSTNDGASWGPEVELSSFYRSNRGVSLAKAGADEIRVNFSWMSRWNSTNYRLRTLVFRLSGSTLSYRRTIYGSAAGLSRPSVSPVYRPGAEPNRFIRVHRDATISSLGRSEISPFGGTSWSMLRTVSGTTPVSPAVGSTASRGWAFAFYLE